MSSGKRDIDGRLFDHWPEKYDRWFETPIGALVKKYETEFLLDLLRPRPGESILDAGCGTGVFTLNILASGPRLTGLDVSLPMLRRTRQKMEGYPF
jgi:ubiquinone/menaquinone biosynthesis C-methylase UbiE